MKNHFFNKELFFLSSKVLIIVLFVLCFILFSIELVLGLKAKKDDELQKSYQDQTILMSYERTPIESLFTTEENIEFARGYFTDEKRFEMFLHGVERSVLPYPFINNLETTADYNSDTKNIVVIGDSFVWGEASLNRNELFWRQLERMLRTKGYNVRVSAIAAEGASAYEEMRWLESGVMEDLKPDIVIFGYVCNDALKPGSGFGIVPVELEIPQLRLVKKICPNIYGKLYHYIDAKTVYSRKFGDAYADENSWVSVLDGELRMYYQIHFVEKLSDFSKKNDLPAIVVTLPNETNSPLYEELFKPMSEIFAGSGISFYDSYPSFKATCSRKKHRNNIYVNVRNVHPGSAAHLFFADFICDFLIKDFSDILGEPANNSLNSKRITVNEIMPGKVNFETVFESDTKSEYVVSYPNINEAHYLFGAEIKPYCLRYPISKDYIKLSFENPVNISNVTISGAEAEKTVLYYTVINPKLGYDDGNVYAWKSTGNDRLKWEAPGTDKIASLCIHLDTPSRITITISGRVDS